MALSSQQTEQVTKMMDAWLEQNRPPETIRPKLDIGWRIENQSVFIFEIRPHWRDKSIIKQSDNAKASWVQSSATWKIYWMRQNLKWHPYEPLPQTGNLQLFLLEYEKDPFGCFRG